MEIAALLIANGAVILLLLAVVFLRYAMRRMFLDPINLYLLNAALFFVIQVPFILVPGNLTLTVGRELNDIWPEIWTAFGMEAGYTLLSVFTLLFLFSSFVKRKMDGVVRRVLVVSSFLMGGQRLYLLFLFPVVLILAAFVIKYGAALFLVDSVGAAQARTVVLREAASFRFLFNFASTALAFLIFFIGLLILDRLGKKRLLSATGLAALFLAGATMGFIITGTRSYVLTPVAILIQTALMFNMRHNTPVKVFGAGFALILLASAMDILRHGGGEFFLLKILYKGNSFADFRDYVWALSRFNAEGREFWMGRTYLASWMSFLPSSLSAFREEWTFGRAIMRVLGWSSTDHFGVRPGITGAIYLNGGAVLVLLSGVIRGIAVYIEQRVYQILLERNASLFAKILMFYIAQHVLLTLFFFLNCMSLWPLYVNLLVLGASFLALPFLRLKLRADNRFALGQFGGPPPPPAAGPPA